MRLGSGGQAYASGQEAFRSGRSVPNTATDPQRLVYPPRVRVQPRALHPGCRAPRRSTSCSRVDQGRESSRRPRGSKRRGRNRGGAMRAVRSHGTGGARESKGSSRPVLSRCRRMRSMTRASVMTAIPRMRAPQRGHANGSTSRILRSSLAQLALRIWVNAESLSSGEPDGREGLTGAAGAAPFCRRLRPRSLRE